MDTKPIRFEQTIGRRPLLDDHDRRALLDEGRAIQNADRRDGTNAFLEAAFDDAVTDEPGYAW